MSYTKTPNKFVDVKPKYPIPMKPHPRSGNPMYALEGEVKEKFIALYPKNTNQEMMKLFGISQSTLVRFARRLGLKKNMKVIHRKWAKAVKQTCEANGYYESLRGKSPSQSCIDAYRRKCKEEGYHPFGSLKKSNPRRYKKLCRQRSEKRKELFLRERLRLEYGLPLQTKLRIQVQPLKHIAYSQKSRMIATHNYFADPDHTRYVCYDSQTDRSPRMEATANRRGLIIVEGEEDNEYQE